MKGAVFAGRVVLSFNHLQIFRNTFCFGNLAEFVFQKGHIQMETLSYEMKVYATSSKSQACLQFLESQVSFKTDCIINSGQKW